MTKEQLENLGALARDLKDRNANLWASTEMEAFAPKEPQTADLILRVLEERQQLLGALLVAEKRYPSHRHDEAEQCDACFLGGRLRAAIAFAEEVAR